MYIDDAGYRIKKVGEENFEVLKDSKSVCVNISVALKSKEENISILKNLEREIGLKLINQELRKQGADISDLDEINSHIKFI